MSRGEAAARQTGPALESLWDCDIGRACPSSLRLSAVVPLTPRFRLQTPGHRSGLTQTPIKFPGEWLIACAPDISGLLPWLSWLGFGWSRRTALPCPCLCQDCVFSTSFQESDNPRPCSARQSMKVPWSWLACLLCFPSFGKSTHFPFEEISVL